MKGVIDAMVPGTGVKLSRLEAYEERINGLKMELFHASQGILALDHADGRLTDRESSIREEIFRAYECIRNLFNSIPEEAHVHIDPPKEESKFPQDLRS